MLVQENIVFLVIDADNNPVAKRRILDKKQPVITIYHKGKLLDSRHASTKEGVKVLLEELLPKTSARASEINVSWISWEGSPADIPAATPTD